MRLAAGGVMQAAGPAWKIQRTDAGVKIDGELRIADATPLWAALRELVDERGKRGKRGEQGKQDELDIDLSDAAIVDGAIMSMLVDLRAGLAARGVRSEIIGASPTLQPIVHLYGGEETPHPKQPEPSPGLFARIGTRTQGLFFGVRRLLVFLGEITSAAKGVFGGPAPMNWDAVPALMSRAGTDGIPIVLLLNFRVGFVMGYQSARQLELYGANVYVADVVGISVTRELAPLMTAIIMSGRSGAAYAAELGSMRVSEELDALRTLGFAPGPFLILPRIMALALVAPALTLFGDVVGVMGGAAVAVMSLGISARGYLAELRAAVVPSDIWTGLAKSVAFGTAIAMIGCQQGFATRGAAEGVGRSTTTTIVACLFAIVVIDTIFTVLFRTFGT